MRTRKSPDNKVADVRSRLRAGMALAPLSSTLTPFDDTGAVDAEGFRRHVKSQLDAQPGTLFTCCGTGEFFSLSHAEYEELVAIAVEVADGRVPVVAGIGYGWAMAVEFAHAAMRAGADAGLLMPYYLDSDEPEKIVEHVLEVSARTALPLIVCDRGRVSLAGPSVEVLTRIPTLIGIKDGHGILAHTERLRSMAPTDWLFYNGAAVAEVQARKYAARGISAYTSPVHAFAPELAGAYFRALHESNDLRVDELLRRFFLPYQTLRSKGSGYAVSLPKAAARLRGAPMGPVRAPLVTPRPEHLDELHAILSVGLELASSDWQPGTPVRTSNSRLSGYQAAGV